MFDDYGKGRQSVILEMMTFCEKELEKLKIDSPVPNEPRSIANSGRRKAYLHIRDILNGKLSNMEAKIINDNFKK